MARCMRIHADFTQTIIIQPHDYQWVKSPGGEVNRMMLDRIGTEKARATSLVEFSAQSQFPKHSHPLGEEVLVLSGIFTENHDQHYTTGWYMRNPHGSKHCVSSETGCQIFVKLMQMTEDELEPTRINTLDPENWKTNNGRFLCPLYTSTFERTFLEKLHFKQILMENFAHGVEILVISGEISLNDQTYAAGTWLRIAQNNHVDLYATCSDTTLYVKAGHLAHAIELWCHADHIESAMT